MKDKAGDELLHVRRRLCLAAEDVRGGRRHRSRSSAAPSPAPSSRPGASRSSRRSSGASRIRGAKVLVFALPGADGITFIRQAEELGLLKDVTVAFLGFAETYLGAFGEGKGQNMWVTVPFAASLDRPGVKEFVAKIRKSAGDGVPISHYAFTHYNSLMAAKAALEKSGKADSEAWSTGSRALPIDSPTGKVTIGKDHHVTMEMFLAKTEGAGLAVVQEPRPDRAQARLRVSVAANVAALRRGRRPSWRSRA